VSQDSYEKAAPLDITPTPDVITRIFMLFKGVPAKDLDAWSAAVKRSHQGIDLWTPIVGVETHKLSDTSAFRVLEWGGMEVGQ
jgi:hypothetical protein